MRFFKGLKQDTAHVNQLQDSYRRARNIILDHTVFSVRTEGALAEMVGKDVGYDLNEQTDYELCGMIALPQDRHLAIILKSNNTHDFVIVSENSYGLLVNRSGYNWSAANPIKGVAYENGREDTIAVWTDGVNPPVYMNITDPAYPILDLFPRVEYPNARSLPIAAQEEGSINNGAYTFFISYEIDRDNITNYSPSYGSFKVGHSITEKVVNTQIGLEFEGLDTTYAFYRIYCIREFNDVRTAFYIGRQLTSNPTFIWTGNSFSETVAEQDLVIPKGWYNTVETLTVADDRLYIANLSRTDGFDPTSWVSNIRLRWSIDARNKYVGAPMLDNYRNKNWGQSYRHLNNSTDLETQITPGQLDHYGMSMGFMPGCSYAFYIAFLLQDGTWTPGYHIPGDAGNVGSEFDPTLIDTSLGEPFPSMNGGDWSSDEFYNGNLGSKSNGNGGYVHVMPNVEQISDAWGDSQFSSQWTGLPSDSPYNDRMWAPTTIGVTATNVNIPTDVEPLIQGYSLFYAKPNANTRDVLAYVPVIEDDGYDGTDTGSSDYFVIYDSYLENTKPDLSTKNIEIVYNSGLNYASDPYTNLPTPASSSISAFEYLPGNVNGNIFNNRHRENRLCFSATINNATTIPQSVKAQADEASELLFGTPGYGPEGEQIALNYRAGYFDEGATGSNMAVITDDSPLDFYIELDVQDLVACSYIEKNVTTSYMNRVSWGGDCTIAPVRYRRMGFYPLANNNSGMNYPTFAEETENNSTRYLYARPQSYFTYTYAIQHLEDLDDPLILNNDIVLANYEPGGQGPAGDYFGSPEIMNPHNYPNHSYKKNDTKPAYTSTIQEPVYTFRNRIARSAKQNYESNGFNWRIFAGLDYYDNALNKGPIRDIESYVGELIIHHTDGLFKTRGKETLDTSDVSVFVGTGDIFRSAPYEIVPTEEGFGGLRKHTDSILCKAGYAFVDIESGRVFLLSDKFSEISREGMRLYFKDKFLLPNQSLYSDANGISIGFDPVYDRLLFTVRTGLSNNELRYKTVSYSTISNCWASTHSYGMQVYGTNKNGIFGFDGLFQHINQGNNTQGAYIELVFNDGGTVAKQFQSFQWNTRVEDGEGDWSQETFDSAIVYNDRGCSNTIPITGNTRFVEEAWNFNNFRNMVADGEEGEDYFDDNDDIADVTIFDMNKPWYSQQRFRGGYAAIRLIISSGRNITLYLNEALARFRVSNR